MSAQKDLHLGNNPLKIVIVTMDVAGGKGSTGKTVATNLALSIESNVLLIDSIDKARLVATVFSVLPLWPATLMATITIYNQ